MILTTKQKLLIPLKISFLANLVCQAVEKQIDLLSDKEILDFGGGTGLLALPLAKQAKSVTLVDISEKMLEQARLKAEQQDIKNIQFWSKIYWKIPWSKSLISLLFVGFFIICLIWMRLSTVSSTSEGKWTTSHC